MLTRFIVSIAIITFPVLAAADDGANWYALTTDDGNKVGYAKHSKTGTKVTYTQTLVPYQTRAAPRRAVRQLTQHKDTDGKTHRIDLRSKGAKTRNHITAIISDEQISLKRKTRAGTSRYALPLRGNVQYDGGDTLFSTWDFGALPALEYLQFNIAAEAVQRVTIVPLRDTAPQSYLKKTYDGENLRAIALLERGPDGKITKLTQPFLASAFIKTAANKRTAKASGKAPKTQDIIGIQSPYQISEAALNGTIRYQFEFKYGADFEIPSTSEQRAVSKNGNVYIEVCGDCGVQEALSPAERTRLTRPTPWLQSGNLNLKTAAQKIHVAALSDDAAMLELGKWARRKLKDVDFAGHYSALDALKLGRGDCTEDAVVLAALGRAADIPTRVVSGLVYSRERYHGISHVFVSHTWTQAWIDGHWKSYDISMENFDAGHIVLAIGDGDPALIAAGNSLSGFLGLKVMAQSKVKPAEDSLP